MFVFAKNLLIIKTNLRYSTRLILDTHPEKSWILNQTNLRYSTRLVLDSTRLILVYSTRIVLDTQPD